MKHRRENGLKSQLTSCLNIMVNQGIKNVHSTQICNIRIVSYREILFYKPLVFSILGICFNDLFNQHKIIFGKCGITLDNCGIILGYFESMFDKRYFRTTPQKTIPAIPNCYFSRYHFSISYFLYLHSSLQKQSPRGVM